MSGDLLGTLRYMSPEQALAKRVIVDERTDIYSLGVTLYELLTLEPAFPGADRQEVLRQIAFDDPKPPRRLNKAIPAELETIVLNAMEKSPADRYATAQELADDLERFLKDEPIRARRPTLVQRARKWARRHKAAVRAAAACLSVTLIALGSAIGWALRDRAAREEGLDQTVDRLLDDEALPLIKARKWPEARAAVERADQLLEAAGRKERPARLLSLQNDLSMAQRLEEIYQAPRRDVDRVRLASGRGTGHTERAPSDPSEEEFFWGREQDGRFAEAFRQFGIDLEALEPAQAAAWIERTSVRQALVQALDHWAAMRLRHRGEDSFWKKLVQIAQTADGDEWRNRLREALLRRDRPALEKLADAVPIARVPPATAYLLGQFLRDLGALDKALAVLREAHRYHPEDFWLNNGLGWLHRAGFRPPRYGQALRYYTAALAVRPQSVAMHNLVAYTLKGTGALDEAMAEYARAIELNPQNAVAWNNRGFAYLELHQYDKGLADLTKAIELEPKAAVIWSNRGGTYNGLHQYDKALADYSKAIELDPKFAAAWSNRGGTYNDLHQYDKALADLTKAIELEPKAAVFWSNRGGTYNGLHEYDKAIVDLDKAIELDPKNAWAWSNRGGAYNGLHEYDKAIVDLDKAIELDPKKGWDWNNRAFAYLGLHQYDKAIADFTKAIELDPKSMPPWNNRGHTYNELHQYDKALGDFNKAIGLDPKYAPAWNDRGYAYLGLHQYDKAIADFTKAIELDPKNALFWSNRGHVYSELHQYDKAIADYSHAIELDPKYALAWMNRGAAYHELHQYDKAIADFTKAIELDPKDAEAWNNRGHAFAGLGQWDKASADFCKATELNPGKPQFWYARALLRLQLGDRAGYRKVCAGMLEQFSQAPSMENTDWTVWSCIQVPDGLDDWAPLVQLAEKSLAADRDNFDHLKALGAALYRAGRFEEAARRLSEAEAAFQKAKDPATTIAYAWLFLAMTHQRLGHGEQAREWLAKAVREIDQPPPEIAKDPNASKWNRKLTLRLLRSEAEALIGRADKKTPQKDRKETEKTP